MKIKSDSWMVWLIESTFGDYRPKSLCTFFWLLVLSIITLPISYIGHIFNFIVTKTNNGSSKVFHLGYSFLSLIAGGGVIIAMNDKLHFFKDKGWEGFLNTWAMAPLGLIAILIAVVLVVCVIGFFVYLMHVIEKWHAKKLEKMSYQEVNALANKKPNIIIEYLKAKKAKICPIIEYTDQSGH